MIYLIIENARVIGHELLEQHAQVEISNLRIKNNEGPHVGICPANTYMYAEVYPSELAQILACVVEP